MRRADPARGKLSRTLRLLAFAGCATGLLHLGCGGSSTEPPPTPPATQEGFLSLVVDGLPAGTGGDVDVSGPDSFARHLTTSALVANVPVGSCTIVAKPVAAAPGDTLFPTPVTQTAIVSETDTASVHVNYARVMAPSLKVFHGPIKFTESRANHYYNLREEYTNPPIILLDMPTVEFPYPDGYLVDNMCRVIGTDVTDSGVTIDSSVSCPFGSASSSSSLVVEDGGRAVTLTNTSSASASAAAGYVGNGSNIGAIDLGYPSGQNLHDLCLAIDNPGGGPFELKFTWSFSGSVTNADYANWKQRFTYQIDALACSSNPQEETLFYGRDFEGPASDAGTFSVPLSGPYHLVSFGLYGEAVGYWLEDYYGRGDSGGAQSQATVTIEVVW